VSGKVRLKKKSSKPEQCTKLKTGIAVAEEIEGVLEEFGVSPSGVKEKVVAATVDYAANMDVAVKR